MKPGSLVLLSALVSVILGMSAACARGGPMLLEEGGMALSVSSTAFQEMGDIPVKYTCDGQDVSPLLAWGEPPQGTRAFALIMDDPDAPIHPLGSVQLATG